MTFPVNPIHPDLQRVLAKQDHDWRVKRALPIEKYLEELRDLNDQSKTDVLAYLVINEIECRRQIGEDPSLDEYHRHYPQLDLQLQLLKYFEAIQPKLVVEPCIGLPTFHGFKTLRRLGGGGMGEVFLAQDQAGEMVAIKSLKKLQELFPSYLDRFHKEFRTAQIVRHENLVQLFEFYSDGDTWYFTMEYVEGEEFLSLFRPGSKDEAPPSTVSEITHLHPTNEFAHSSFSGLSSFQIDRLRSVLKQILQGLLALNRNCLIHRDIKSSNVLVTKTGQVKIVDFGLAVQLNEQGQPLTSRPDAGTLANMAPEHLRGSPEYASDMYSLGVMVYQALTGQHPFPARKTLAGLFRTDPLPSPRNHVSTIPPDLDSLCVRLLEEQPGGRPTPEEALRSLGSHVPTLSTQKIIERPFVGRIQELQILTDAFRAVQNRKCPIVVEVYGQSTLGKSTLVEHWLADLRSESNVMILTGVCREQILVPNRALDSLALNLADSLSRLEKKGYLRLLDRVLPTYIRELVRMFPVLNKVETVAKRVASEEEQDEPLNEQENRDRAMLAWRELLTKLVREQPVVLFLDDLQWGDSESADLLLQLLRPPDAPRLLLVVCYRTEDLERSPCLPKLLQAWEQLEGKLHRYKVPIEKLDPKETQQLARALLGAGSPEDQVIWVADQAQDNPFLVFLQVQRLQARPQEFDPLPVQNRVSLGEILLNLIQDLSEDAQGLFKVIAVAEHPLPWAIACQVAKLGPKARKTLYDLHPIRLLRSTGVPENKEIDIIHDSVRQVMKTTLSAADCKDYHHGLAVQYETLAQKASETYLNATVLLDFAAQEYEKAENFEKAASYYAQAARGTADTLNFKGAVERYERWLALQKGRGEPDPTVLTEYADALANSGLSFRAAEYFKQAARGADKADLIDLKTRAARHYLISGHVERGRRIFREALAGAGLPYPSSPYMAKLTLMLGRWQLRIRGLRFRRVDETQLSAEVKNQIELCWAAVGLSNIDPIFGAYFHIRGLLLALRAGESYRVARAVATEAAHLSTEGCRFRQRVEHLLQMAVDLSHSLPEKSKMESNQKEHIKGINALAQGVAAHFWGSWEKAQTLCDNAATIFYYSCPGASWELVTARRFAMRSLCYLGNLVELRKRLPVQLGEAQTRGDVYAKTNLVTYIGTLDSLAADEPDKAEQSLEEALREWSEKVGDGFHVQHHNALMARMLICLYISGGSTSFPWQMFCQKRPDYQSSFILRGQLTRIEFYQAHGFSALAAAQAIPKESRSLLKAAEAYAQRLRREGMPLAQAMAWLILAGVAAFRGRSEISIQLLQRGHTELETLSMGLYAAVTGHRLGKQLGGQNGQSHVEKAEVWMIKQGVKNPARLVAALLPGFAAS